MRSVRSIALVVALMATLMVTTGTGFARQLINGAGATFPYPIYSKWFSEYHKLNPDVQINYQSIGSGGGIQQMLQGTVDFGATDGPMTDAELAQAKAPILHLPTVIGAVVATYNIAGVTDLKLTPEALSGIFLGTVTKWNDPAIAGANPGVTLPSAGIIVIHRSDGSGTTYVFTDYLAKVSEAWKTKPGAGKSVAWPVGLGGKGNEGVTGLVKQTPNSIGYVELVYALQNTLPYASLKNRAGNFVVPTIESVTAAANVAEMPADYRVSITDSADPQAYPIASFTWLLIPSKIADATKGKALVGFLQWMLGPGQTMAAPLHYAPLPEKVVALERKTIEGITVGN